MFVDLLPSGFLFVRFSAVRLQLFRQILARLPRIVISILEDEPCLEIDDSLFVKLLACSSLGLSPKSPAEVLVDGIWEVEEGQAHQWEGG